MCNRYNLQDPPTAREFIEEALRVGFKAPDWFDEPRFNVAVGSMVPVVAQGPAGFELRRMAWGLVPIVGSQGERHTTFYPNATRAKIPTWAPFRRCAERRRCLVPVNGYYEFEHAGKLRYPHLFSVKGQAAFALAGIWEVADEQTPETVAVVTTEPNALAAKVHDRMPVVLTQEAAARWMGLSGATAQTGRTLAAAQEPMEKAVFEVLTAPAGEGVLEEREVNRYVNNSKHEGPQCVAAPDFRQLELL